MMKVAQSVVHFHESIKTHITDEVFFVPRTLYYINVQLRTQLHCGAITTWVNLCGTKFKKTEKLNLPVSKKSEQKKKGKKRKKKKRKKRRRKGKKENI